MIIKSMLVISELLFLVILHSISAIKPGKVIADLNLYLYYANADHLAAEGYCDRTLNDNWCDTYFIICLTSANSTEKCNVYKNKTEIHYDKTYVKYDDEHAFRIPLRYPIPEPIKIEVTAMDYDRFTEHDLIGVFANDVMIPSSNVITNAGLVNVNKNYNQKVNLTVLMTKHCSKGFYGNTCTTECVPEMYQSMIGCHDNGTSICLPGFRGQFCEKPDACFYRPCIPGAECINADDKKNGYRCICDGVESDHCYAGYNPCVPSPCKNQGQCVRTGVKHETFTCNCPIQWTGRLCEKQLSPCEVARQKLAYADLNDLFGQGKYKNQSTSQGLSDKNQFQVCKNGGICVDLMDEFKFICNCTSGWKGELCEIPDWTNTIIAACVVIGLLLILLCAIIPCCLRMKALQRTTPVPIEPLVYGRRTNEPATERIQINETAYNSFIFPNRFGLSSADNTQQNYDYCSLPSTRDSVLNTFASNEYELPVEDKAPPLPYRPDSLPPISYSPDVSVTREAEILHSPRSDSTYSRQPLLSPRTSGLSPGAEGVDHVSLHYVEALPTRSNDCGESTLSKLLKKPKK
nr:fibropellin Ia [Hymenolepis microstoma]